MLSKVGFAKVIMFHIQAQSYYKLHLLPQRIFFVLFIHIELSWGKQKQLVKI